MPTISGFLPAAMPAPIALNFIGFKLIKGIEKGQAHWLAWPLASIF